MNLALIDVHTRNLIPENIQYDLRDDGSARVAVFNRTAGLLAAGCSDGRVVIWDFPTRAIMKVLVGHVQPITSVSWSRNCKFLVTGSGDCNVIVWNVETAVKVAHFKFETPILHVQFHPKGESLVVVSSLLSHSYEVNLNTQERRILPIAAIQEKTPTPTSAPSPAPEPATPTTVSATSEPADQDVPSIEKPAPNGAANGATTASSEPKKAGSSNPYSPIAIYSNSGQEIYIGDSRGMVVVLDSKTLEVKHSFRICNSGGVKGLVASSDRKWLLINCSDRCLRLWDLEKNALHKEMFDAVNRQQWKTVIFSPDNEFVLAAASHRHEHKIYFYNVFSGRLFKNLEGPKEGILDLQWHPNQPIMASVSSAGTIYVWGSHHDESWSAFTPGFTELEANEEYIEREDEFDELDAEHMTALVMTKKPKLVEEDDGTFIDILSFDNDPYNSDLETEDTNGVASSKNTSELLTIGSYIIPDRYIAPDRVAPSALV